MSCRVSKPRTRNAMLSREPWKSFWPRAARCRKWRPMWSPILPRSLTTSTAAGLSEPATRLLKKPAVAAGFFMPETKNMKPVVIPVGASLLAMAECQATFILNVKPSSRASSLPQVLCQAEALFHRASNAGNSVRLRISASGKCSASQALPAGLNQIARNPACCAPAMSSPG
ncbi:hypothetical protein D3C81_1270780 [compost metagenome]